MEKTKNIKTAKAKISSITCNITINSLFAHVLIYFLLVYMTRFAQVFENVLV